jgi:hypothetical protein
VSAVAKVEGLVPCVLSYEGPFSIQEKLGMIFATREEHGRESIVVFAFTGLYSALLGFTELIPQQNHGGQNHPEKRTSGHPVDARRTRTGGSPGLADDVKEQTKKIHNSSVKAGRARHSAAPDRKDNTSRLVKNHGARGVTRPTFRPSLRHYKNS